MGTRQPSSEAILPKVAPLCCNKIPFEGLPHPTSLSSLLAIFSSLQILFLSSLKTCYLFYFFQNNPQCNFYWNNFSAIQSHLISVKSLVVLFFVNADFSPLSLGHKDMGLIICPVFMLSFLLLRLYPLPSMSPFLSDPILSLLRNSKVCFYSFGK